MSEPVGGGWSRTRWIIAALAGLLVVAAVVSVVLLTRGGGKPTVGAAPTTGTPTGTASPSPPATATPSAPATPSPGPPTVAPPAFAYVPLWPFAGLADARAWQDSYRTGGHQPWHQDPCGTALSFAQGFLGFHGVDRVLACPVRGGDARVSLGYHTEGTRSGVAAVVHVVRLAANPDTWEVVGTDDTTFSITTPRYGATVSSPVTVGGRITGVDESIHVQVRQLATERPLGDRCCLPAGGTNAPWSTGVSYRGATGSALVIVAWTGGHIAEVERFTVTGVRPAR